MPTQKKRWTKKDMLCLSGKLAIVTGAAGGIGYEIALGLAEAGAEVILVDRNEDGGKCTLRTLSALLPDARVSFECLDLGSLENVREFCIRFNARSRALDILVNNAGVMVAARTPNRELTAEGFEAHFGINYLAHFALVAQLLPSLRLSTASRVVNVGSLSYRFAKINFEDLQMENGYGGMKAYGQSKLANLLFTIELQRRSDEGNWGLKAVSSHPGFAITGIANSGRDTCFERLIARYVGPFIFRIQDASTGALPALFSATDPESKAGEYYGPSKRFETMGPVGTAYRAPKARDSAVAKKLWDISVELTNVNFS